jgi:hypothetical protein
VGHYDDILDELDSGESWEERRAKIIDQENTEFKAQLNQFLDDSDNRMWLRLKLKGCKV